MLHDDICLVHRGGECNCPSAAFLRDGVSCGHPGCIHHITQPCEGCGRIGGISGVKRTVEIHEIMKTGK